MVEAAAWSACRVQRRGWRSRRTASIAAPGERGGVTCLKRVRSPLRSRARHGDGPGNAGLLLSTSCVAHGGLASVVLAPGRRDRVARVAGPNVLRLKLARRMTPASCHGVMSSSDSARWWLSLDGESDEADAFEFDASGALSAIAIGLEEVGQDREKDWSAIALEEANMGVGAAEDVLVEGINGTVAGTQGDPCNTVNRSDSHSADMGSSILATESHEDKGSVHSAAGAHTTREIQAPTPLGMLPRSIRRKNVRRSSGTSRKKSAAHGPPPVPWNGSGTMPLPFPPAGASGLHIPIMAASLVIARETHWAQSQLALQYAACAQMYENSLRNYPHMQRGPAALHGSQTPMVMLEPYQHCFFPPHYHVHHHLQIKGQRKAKSTATTSPWHPDQDKQAEGGGCSGPGEEEPGVRGKQLPSTAEDVRASTDVQPQHTVIAQVKYERCRNGYT